VTHIAAKILWLGVPQPGTLRTKLGATLHQPGLVSLAFGRKQGINLFCFGAIEQEVLWEFLFTDAASPMTATVNDRIAGRTMLLTQADTDS